MYKIFINEKPFIIALPNEAAEIDAQFTQVPHHPSKVASYIKECELLNSKGLVMVTDDLEFAFTDFYTHFVAIEAAGGIVFNPLQEVLLIKRLGKWDLPKGKMDSGETPEEAGLREVEEECGVNGLSIVQQLPTTYHCYKQHNHRFLKITYWYQMKIEQLQELIPQKEEHITEAIWQSWKSLDLEKIDSYLSIKELLLEVKQQLP